MLLKSIKLNKSIIFTGLFLFLISCKLPQAKKEAPQINEINKETIFRINLLENHNSGYIWQLERNFNNAVVGELMAVWHGNEKGIDFNFKPLSTGQTTLNFVLTKYNDTLDRKGFIVKIIDN